MPKVRGTVVASPGDAVCEVTALRKRHLGIAVVKRVARKGTLPRGLADTVIVFAANCLKAWQTREELRGGKDGDNPRVNIEL